MTRDSTETVLQVSDTEKDLGVWVDNKLRFDLHAERTASKASRLVGMIRRTYVYLDKRSMTTLYKSLCRPILEFGNVIWHPQYQKDAVVVENVQRRATKLIPGLRDMEYEDRMRHLKLPSLAYRRDRGDMIEVYKRLNGHYKYPFTYLKLSSAPVRGHSQRLFKEHARHQCRRKFFSQRVVDIWNSLPEEVVTLPTLNQFKNKLDAHWEHYMYSQTSPSMRTQTQTRLASQSKTSHRM